MKQAAIAAVLGAGAMVYALAGARSGSAPVEAGFWFDEVAFDSARLAGPLTPDEIATIESVALGELRDAFHGLPIVFSRRRDARYTIRVVQELLDQRFKRPVGTAGQSRGLIGFGGSGAVSFDFLANGAMSYVPDGAGREVLIAAIGRGIGRTAVHEFTHQLLPRAPIHDSRDDQSYEFRSAARHAQYLGPMRWNLARPLLEARLCGAGSEVCSRRQGSGEVTP